MSQRTILYVGPLWEGGTCLQRMKALECLGHAVTPIDTEPPEVRYKQRTFLFRLRRKVFGPEDLANANQMIFAAILNHSYDILWIDKGLTIAKETLLQVKQHQPGCTVVGYSPDDMAGRHNQSRDFLGHLGAYDCFITTKSYNLSELKDLGCPRVLFVGNAFDPHTHRPVPISVEEKRTLGGPIGFIGAFERARAESILFLNRMGLGTRVYGPGWKKLREQHSHIRIENKEVFGDEYARAICAFDINLCFLRKLNRDLQTTRSLEIPACGAFMLAERTSEHLELFEEGKEAEFFASDEELTEKARFYLAHAEVRRRIAAAGYQRCLKSGYSNQERLKGLLQKVMECKA